MHETAVAFRFLANLFQPGVDRIAPRPTYFELEAERLDVDVYEPRRKPLGAVLMVHGMNVRAHRDPRLMTASQAMAGVGFRVFTPRFPDVGSAVISYRSVERIAASIEEVSQRTGRPVGVFAPSFSAAMSLIASTQDRAAGCVAAVFAMGTYCNPRSVIRYVLEDETAHEYGRLIVMRNFLHRSVGPIPELEAALDIAIIDAALRRDVPEHPRYFEALESDHRQLIEALLSDVPTRLAHVERMVNADHDRLLERMSVASVAERVTAPVTLFHGAGDDVIPPEESICLAQLLERGGTDVHLNISPLISHGDTQSFWKERQAVFDALRTFSHFFGNVVRRTSVSSEHLEAA